MNRSQYFFKIPVRRRSKFVVRTFFPVAISNIWQLLGTSIVLLYVARVSVLSLWADPYKLLLQLGGQGLLVVGFVLIFAKKITAFSVPGIVFIALTFPGVLIAENFSQPLLNWAAWSVLFAVAGPVIQSEPARALRLASWSTFRWTFVLIAILSFGWYVAGLPNLGRGAFTGVMVHSMLLGPIAGMASLFLAHRAILTRSRLCLFFSFLVMIPCLLAGSRSALLGLGAGALVLMVFSIGRMGLNKSLVIILAVVSFGVLGFVFLEEVKDNNISYRYTQELQKKGLNNSRDRLWSARLSEFSGSPIVGLGIGMGKVDFFKARGGVVVGASGEINVEPGSSYLAVLSMTGILGALGFFFVFASNCARVKASGGLKRFDPELFEVLAICAFFAVHMAAEGYIFAIGNQFCLLLWLCFGRVRDFVSHRAR